MFFPEYIEDFSPGLYYPSGHSTLQLAILAGLSRSPSLPLTSLTITGLIAVHNELFNVPPFCALFEQLTYLRLGAISKTFFEGHMNMINLSKPGRRRSPSEFSNRAPPLFRPRSRFIATMMLASFQPSIFHSSPARASHFYR